MSNKAAVIHEKGAPDVFCWEDWPVGEPGPGEALIRHGAIGVNYIDTYNRRGMPHPWPVPPLPVVLGIEGAGTVEAVGDGVTECAVGDRVAYASPPHGAYAQRRLMPARRLVRLPDGISEEDAAAVTLKGLTAQYLLRRTYRVQRGDPVLVHAAAGGMGLILCQWARHLGATVIGTVSTDEKAELARAHGANHVAVYSREDFVPLVMEVTEGRGCPVVYESIGKDTFNPLVGLPAPARHPGELRTCFGRTGPGRRGGAGRARLAVRHPAGAHALHGRTRGPAGCGAGAVRRRVVGGGDDRRPQPISAA